jgi:hypothetical protein
MNAETVVKMVVKQGFDDEDGGDFRHLHHF